MNNYNENEIIALLHDPDRQREAFERIVQKYSETLYWQIRRIVLSHDDANDILQNTFFKAWQNIEYFRGEAKMSTWLFRIAFNECLAFTNKKRASETVSFDNVDSDILNKLESDPYFNGDKIQRELHKAIQKLPEKQRLVFNMRYFDEMKYEDISEITGTSVGALKASYHHAYNKIKTELEEMMIDR